MHSNFKDIKMWKKYIVESMKYNNWFFGTNTYIKLFVFNKTLLSSQK